MELKPRSHQKIVELLQKGVDIPNPLTLDIGEEVRTENISGTGVKIHPGCRIYGKETVIAQGAGIGAEGPVTIDNCQVGPRVELKGGYFKGSVFLAGADMGSGAHVRDACILEEEANGAHCVGLKQTILFPFVTLGSLINFCDCLMAGGKAGKITARSGARTFISILPPMGTRRPLPSLGTFPGGDAQPAGDLSWRPGGMVGPVRLGYGNISVAGTILRRDCPEDRKKIVGETYPATVTDFEPHRYSNLGRVLKNNILYLANLVALEFWYKNVRRQFFSSMEYGDLLYRGALDKLALAKKERTTRLIAMVEKIPPSHEKMPMLQGQKGYV